MVRVKAIRGQGQGQGRAPMGVRRLFTKCRHAGRRYLIGLKPLVTASNAARVQYEQLKLLSLTGRLFALVGTSSVALLTVDFWPDLTLASASCCLAIPVTYALLIRQEFEWRRRRVDRRYLHSALTAFGVLGILWGSLINLLASVANTDQRGLLDAIMIALVSTPLVASPLSAALAFWVPSAFAGAVLIARSFQFDLYLMLCYLGYSNFTLAAMFISNRFLLERSTGRIVLEQQNDTISVFLRDYEENGSDWLWETDAALQLLNVSARFADVARQSRVALEGMYLAALFKGEPGPPINSFIKMLADHAPFRNVLMPVVVKGELRWWMLTGRPVIGDDARFTGYHGIGSDVTDVRRSEDRVRYLALHDSLTGLANRQSFMDALHASSASAIDSSQGSGSLNTNGSPKDLALMLLDLDRFKRVNDTHGHAVGDELLVSVAARLRSCTRNDGVIARLGGDEFGLLLAIRDPKEATDIAQRIVDALAQDHHITGVRHSVGCSLGLAFIDPNDASSVSMQRADVALYAAKDAGRGVFRVFGSDMVIEQNDRFELQSDLRSVIRSGSLDLAFQPIFDVSGARIVSVEALCRWDHPALGQIPPAVFIPMAEEIGMIVELGAWVLDTACRSAVSWPSDIRLAVNVSMFQIFAGEFESVVASTLSGTGLSASRLELELTESAYMEATDGVVQTLRILRERGSRIILDDFCTGQSSLSYLTLFECDGLKIDSSFVQNVDTDAIKTAVVRAISQLADDLNIPVTAEGVENQHQLDILRGFGVTQIQGHLLARPVAAEEVLELFSRQQIVC